MAVFEFENAEEIRRVCEKHGVQYLFFAKVSEAAHSIWI